MNPQEQIKNDFLEALQGDVDAIDRVSARLAVATASQADGQDRDSFLDAVGEFRQNFRDLVNNLDDYAAVVREDAKLARSHPQLGYRERLAIAGNAVRSGNYDDVDRDADTSMTIKQMGEWRQPRPLKAQQPQASHEDDDDAQAIASMAQARGRVAR